MKSAEPGSARVPSWCATCSTRHGLRSVCPGELPATGPERHSWRGLAETPLGVEAYGVLVAPSHELWRARILTYPNVLWLVPGGVSSIKFSAKTSRGAERRAIEFIREHCDSCGYKLREDRSCVPEASSITRVTSTVPRKVRFLPVRFGLVGPTEPAGTGNLSEAGMFIITNTPVDPGTSVRVALETPHKTLELEAEVRWMRRQHHVGRAPGMGVCIKMPPPDYVSYVRSLG